MGALTRQHETAFRTADWQPDVTALLDEHHMAAWTADARRRVLFATRLGHFLETQRDTEVVSFYGRFITDLESFCYQLESALPGQPLSRRIHGTGGVVSLLRQRETFQFRAPPKFRYYVWHDCDVLIKRDPVLFGRLAESVMGVAAENEYVSDDALMVQRIIFMGGSVLREYAMDGRGQLRSWYDDGHPDPFWRVVTGIDAPSVKTYKIDALQ